MRCAPLGSGRCSCAQPDPASTHVLCSKRMLRVSFAFQYSNEYSLFQITLSRHVTSVSSSLRPWFVSAAS